MSTQTLPSPLAQPSFAELFTPKLVSVLREGYSFASFRADLMAGLTVAIVALPLSMAIAIGSHATPAQGLYTSIVGGFVVSLLRAVAFRSADRRAPSSCLSRPRCSSTAWTA
jgi:sulfate permease, SulP family